MGQPSRFAQIRSHTRLQPPSAVGQPPVAAPLATIHVALDATTWRRPRGAARYQRSVVLPPPLVAFAARPIESVDAAALDRHLLVHTRSLLARPSSVGPPAAPTVVPRPVQRIGVPSAHPVSLVAYLRQKLAPLLGQPRPPQRVLAPSAHPQRRASYQATGLPAPLPAVRPIRRVGVPSTRTPGLAMYLRQRLAPLLPVPRPLLRLLAPSPRPAPRTAYTRITTPIPLPPGPRPIRAVLAGSNRGPARTGYRATNVAPTFIPTPRAILRWLAASFHSRGVARLQATNVAAPLRPPSRPIGRTLAPSAHPQRRASAQATGVPPPAPSTGGPQFWPVRMVRGGPPRPMGTGRYLRQNLAPLRSLPRSILAVITRGKATAAGRVAYVLPQVAPTAAPAAAPRPVLVIRAAAVLQRALNRAQRQQPPAPVRAAPPIRVRPDALIDLRDLLRTHSGYSPSKTAPLIPVPRAEQAVEHTATTDAPRFVLLNGRVRVFRPPAPLAPAQPVNITPLRTVLSVSRWAGQLLQTRLFRVLRFPRALPGLPFAGFGVGSDRPYLSATGDDVPRLSGSGDDSAQITGSGGDRPQ
jgi:hypothetical protein